MKLSSYFKPKSMVYTGSYSHIKTIIKHWEYNAKGVEEIENLDINPEKKHYIQIVGLADIEKIQEVKQHLSIDPLVMEDIFNVNQRNKLELKDDYLFGTFSYSYMEGNLIKKDYMSILMFSNTILTFHETEPIFLDDIKYLFKEHIELRELPMDYLLFQILDIITDHQLEVYDTLDAAINDFETQILETKNIEQESFYLIRKQMLQLKNNVSPIFEQLEKVLSKNNGLFSKATTTYFEDLKDHLHRLDSRLNQSREMTHQLLDLHINNQGNKMNKIMATLTLFSATFIPLSFLTGFFGMNFTNFTLLHYQNAILVFAIVCLVIAIVMILFFKRKKWL
ncbi:MAG: hypothetical protein JXC31_00895 [Acholeplasmataceae bacterium]|nr:hypothetical protein [Acholeplasmataceae bacterium]